MAVLSIGLSLLWINMLQWRVTTLESELGDARLKADQVAGAIALVRQEAAQLRDELGPVPGTIVAPLPPLRLGPPTIRERINQLQQRLEEQDKKIKDLETQLAKLKDKANP